MSRITDLELLTKIKLNTVQSLLTVLSYIYVKTPKLISKCNNMNDNSCHY